MGLREVYRQVPISIRVESSRLTGIDDITDIDVGMFDWCNRRCSYCPVSAHPGQHSKNGDTILSQSVWDRLVDNLAEMNFSGRVSPHHYNEPLLRYELVKERLLELRAKVPKCKIVLYTNGDLLPKYFTGLIGVCDTIIVSLHEGRRNKELLGLLNSRELNRYFRVEIKNIGSSEYGLLDRTNAISPQRIWHPTTCPNYDFGRNTLVINPRGQVVNCIQDHDADKVWGDLSSQSVQKIWGSKEYAVFRERMRTNDSLGFLGMCYSCLGVPSGLK